MKNVIITLLLKHDRYVQIPIFGNMYFSLWRLCSAGKCNAVFPTFQTNITHKMSLKYFVPSLEFRGAESFCFYDLGGLAHPSPYVEPPLDPRTLTTGLIS